MDKKKKLVSSVYEKTKDVKKCGKTAIHIRKKRDLRTGIPLTTPATEDNKSSIRTKVLLFMLF